MKIEPKILNNVALNSHPIGCKKNIENLIMEATSLPKITEKKLNVLIIGGSSGYGLATRVLFAFNAKADVYSVSFERGPKGKNTASAGYYNNLFFQEFAHQKNLDSIDLNIDAFSREAKEKVIADLKAQNKKIDVIVYSLASGVRQDPVTGIVHHSALKPTSKSFTGYNVDIAKKNLYTQVIDPATSEEISNTIKVMGGEDYKMWIESMVKEDVLSEGVTAITYTYIGSPITHAIYKDGTIGHAKKDLERTVVDIQTMLDPLHGTSIVSSSKTVVTKASVFIPSVSVYGTCLFEIMKKEGIHESILKHKHRLFYDMVFGNKKVVDEKGRYRLDAYELEDSIQKQVQAKMDIITPENFKDNVDFDSFYQEFMQLNGFNVEGVDYDEDIDLTHYL